MDHHPYVAIVMTAGGDVLKTETASDVPVTGAPRIGAFQNVALATRMERTVGLHLIAVRPIEALQIDSFRIESLQIDILRNGNLLIAGPPLIVAPLRAALQATVFQIVAQEIRSRVTAVLLSIVDPHLIGLQIAPQIVPLGIAPQRIAPPQTGLMTVAPLKALSQINVFPNVVLKIRAQRIVVLLLIAVLLIAARLIAPMESVERVLRSVVVRAAAAVKAFQHAWTTNPVVSRVLMPRRLLPMTCSGGVMPLRRL